MQVYGWQACVLSESTGWDCCTSNQSFAKEMPEYEHAY